MHLLKDVKFIFLYSLLLLVGAAEHPLKASMVFSGTLVSDEDLKTFFFKVSDESTITIRTLGYAGGTQSDGNVVPSGGFDSFLTLFVFPGGDLVTTNDDGPNANSDPETGQWLDAAIQQDLAPGSYLAVLSQYDNAPNGSTLLSGFSQSGNPNFTNNPTFALGDPCPTAQFRDSTGGAGHCRNGSYTIEFTNALDITESYSQLGLPPMAPTPEPNTFLSFLAAASCWIGTKRCRQTKLT